MATLFCCSCLVGCIEQPAELPTLQSFASFPDDPIIAKPAAGVPVPDPFLTPAEPAEPVPLDPVGYTGVRIFSDPESCNPCRNLETDLQYLREKHGWTVSDSEAVAADWQILPARKSDWRIPLIEIWQDGRMVDSFAGYSDAASFEARRGALLQLMNCHPLRTLERD